MAVVLELVLPCDTVTTEETGGRGGRPDGRGNMGPVVLDGRPRDRVLGGMV